MTGWSAVVCEPGGRPLLATGRTGRAEALALAATVGRFWPRLRVRVHRSRGPR